jgi:MoaA/NifB/PqqE/SkfB family radical SAM enzyme
MRRQFTSTGYKLIYHPTAILRAMGGYGTPVTVQVAPTSRCNLKCVFCSNVNRAASDLNFDIIAKALTDLKQLGTKGVEITGGGDPTLYGDINELIELCLSLNFDVGMISNGILLKSMISEKLLNKLTWLRISMNCLDYVDSVDIPKISGILGFSYVWNVKTTNDVLDKLEQHRKEYLPSYIRIVPNCQCTDEEQERNNEILSDFVYNKMGPDYFYQAKQFGKPKTCYWGYFKPFILHDGFVYPCSSIVLNDSADRKFHESFQWCAIEQLVEKCCKPIKSFNTINCNHCVFCKQNEIIADLLEPMKDKNFI